MAFKVTNTGNVEGAAVPQVYLGAPSNQPSGNQFAVRQLVQFTRVPLLPHQSEWVSVHVALRQLQYWSSATPAVANSDVVIGPSGSVAPTRSAVPGGDPGAVDESAAANGRPAAAHGLRAPFCSRGAGLSPWSAGLHPGYQPQLRRRATERHLGQRRPHRAER